MLSVSNCRARRCQPAPSAVRMATSFSRPAARASRRLATLAQAINRTSATEPSSTSKSAAHVADHLLLQADDIHAEAGVALVFAADAAGDDVDVGLGLLHGNAGFEADDDVVVFVAPALCGIGSQWQGEKDVHLVHGSFRGHDFSVEHKAALQARPRQYMVFR